MPCFSVLFFQALFRFLQVTFLKDYFTKQFLRMTIARSRAMLKVSDSRSECETVKEFM